MKTIYLLANGDARIAVNQACWPAQVELEARLLARLEEEGQEVRRAHLFEAKKGHGFIDSLKMGLEVFRSIPADAPVIVAGAGWQCSQQVWPGLAVHDGPILTVAKWSGTGSGVASVLDLNGCLTRTGVKFASLWSEDFADGFFVDGLRRWLEKGKLKHEPGTVRTFDLKPKDAPADLGDAMRTGRDFGRRFQKEKTIMGLFDGSGASGEGGSVPAGLLRVAGVFKERLSLATLFARIEAVREAEARGVYEWYRERGVSFRLEVDAATELTEAQVLAQCRVYVAAVRLADESGCAALGIVGGGGEAGRVTASGLVKGTLNNVERPPVFRAEGGEELFAGEALPCFHDGGECAGLDGLVTYRLWRELGYPPENTSYLVRWGRDYRDDSMDAFVWVFQAEGGAPPAHFGGWGRAMSEREPAMFGAGAGGTLKGVSRPGWIVWSRVYVEYERRLCCDAGIAEVMSLPMIETEGRWQQTTLEWPIMHAVLQGITRDEMLARQPSGRVQVVYAPDKEGARRGLFAKAAAMRELGLEVAIRGNISGER